MPDNDTYLYAVDTFSAGSRPVHGPREMRPKDALAYLAQRLADQHPGCLSPAYWTNRAAAILADSAERAGVACTWRVARGRGVIVTAEPLPSAAAFEVRVFPLFEDEESTEEVIACFEHPRLVTAMREAGIRAEAWMRIDCEEVRLAQERAPLVGFEAEITARLSSPLPAAIAVSGGEAGEEGSAASRRTGERAGSAPVPQAA